MNFKFGVLYCKEGQSSDDEMYGNGKFFISLSQSCLPQSKTPASLSFPTSFDSQGSVLSFPLKRKYKKQCVSDVPSAPIVRPPLLAPKTRQDTPGTVFRFNHVAHLP